MNKTLKEQYNILNEYALDDSREFWHFDSDEIVDRAMGRITMKHKGYFWIVSDMIEKWGGGVNLSSSDIVKIVNTFESKDYEEFVTLLDNYHIRWCFLFWDNYDVERSQKEYSKYIISDIDEKISYSINDGNEYWVSSGGSKELDEYTTIMIYNDKFATIKKVS